MDGVGPFPAAPATYRQPDSGNLVDRYFAFDDLPWISATYRLPKSQAPPEPEILAAVIADFKAAGFYRDLFRVPSLRHPVDDPKWQCERDSVNGMPARVCSIRLADDGRDRRAYVDVVTYAPELWTYVELRVTIGY